MLRLNQGTVVSSSAADSNAASCISAASSTESGRRRIDSPSSCRTPVTFARVPAATSDSRGTARRRSALCPLPLPFCTRAFGTRPLPVVKGAVLVVQPEEPARKPPLDRTSQRRSLAPAVRVTAAGAVSRVMYPLRQRPAHGIKVARCNSAVVAASRCFLDARLRVFSRRLWRTTSGRLAATDSGKLGLARVAPVRRHLLAARSHPRWNSNLRAPREL